MRPGDVFLSAEVGLGFVSVLLNAFRLSLLGDCSLKRAFLVLGRIFSHRFSRGSQGENDLSFL